MVMSAAVNPATPVTVVPFNAIRIDCPSTLRAAAVVKLTVGVIAVDTSDELAVIPAPVTDIAVIAALAGAATNIGATTNVAAVIADNTLRARFGEKIPIVKVQIKNKMQ
jgi:hypothetical protein